MKTFSQYALCSVFMSLILISSCQSRSHNSKQKISLGDNITESGTDADAIAQTMRGVSTQFAKTSVTIYEFQRSTRSRLDPQLATREQENRSLYSFRCNAVLVGSKHAITSVNACFEPSSEAPKNAVVRFYSYEGRDVHNKIVKIHRPENGECRKEIGIVEMKDEIPSTKFVQDKLEYGPATLASPTLTPLSLRVVSYNQRSREGADPIEYPMDLMTAFFNENKYSNDGLNEISGGTSGTLMLQTKGLIGGYRQGRVATQARDFGAGVYPKGSTKLLGVIARPREKMRGDYFVRFDDSCQKWIKSVTENN